MFALQRDRRQRVARRLPASSSPSCSRYLEDELPARPPASRGSPALPGRPERARAVAARLLAAERDLGGASSGCRTRSPTSSTRRAPRSRALYRERFAPSRRARRSPSSRSASAAICAETDEEAERLAAERAHGDHAAAPGPADRRCRRSRRRSRSSTQPVPVGRSPAGRRVVVGIARDACAPGSRQVAAEYGADEVAGRDDHLRPRGAPPLLRADRRGLRSLIRSSVEAPAPAARGRCSRDHRGRGVVVVASDGEGEAGPVCRRAPGRSR